MSAISVRRADAGRGPALAAGAVLWLRGLARLAPVAAAVWVPYQLVQAVLFAGLGVGGNASAIDAAGGRLASGGTVGAGALAGPAMALALYAVISLALAVVALSLAQAGLSRVADAELAGTRAGTAEALRFGLRRLPAVVGTNMLLGLLIVGVELGIAVLAAALSFIAGLAGLAPVATGLGALALIAAPIVVFARLSTAPQAAALDGLDPTPALKDAWLRLHGHFLSSLAVVVVTGAVSWIGAYLLELAVGRAGGSGTTSTFAAAAAAAVAAIVFGPLPQVALTVLHREAQRPADYHGPALPPMRDRATPV